MLEWAAEYGGTTALTYYRLEESMDRFEATMEAVAAFEERGDFEVITIEVFAEESVL